MRKCDKMGYISRRLDIPASKGMKGVMREFPANSRNPFFVDEFRFIRTTKSLGFGRRRREHKNHNQ